MKKLDHKSKIVKKAVILFIAAIFLSSSATMANTNQPQNQTTLDEGYVMTIEDSTAHAGDTNHVIEVTGSWEQEIFAYGIRLDYGPTTELGDITVIEANINGCVGEGGVYFNATIKDYGDHGSINILMIWGSVIPGDGIAAGDGKLANIVVDIAPTAEPQIISIVDNQSSGSYYWNESYTVDADVIDGELEIIEDTPEDPVLAITSVEGGMGLSYSIENQGTADATDVKVKVTAEDGFFIFPKETTIEVGDLGIGEDYQGNTVFIGFGGFGIFDAPTFTLTASCNEESTDELTVKGKIVFLFIILDE